MCITCRASHTAYMEIPMFVIVMGSDMRKVEGDFMRVQGREWSHSPYSFVYT